MNLNNFTLKAQESVQHAFNIAAAKGQQSVECAHLLKGVMSEAESITGFLLGKLGVNEGSFSFHNLTVASGHNEYPYHMYIYYAFITMTTTGYGDIVPLTPVARSLAVFISVTGQLYVAVVIALLVGKYITQQVNSNRE